jgi:hypothetical protein
LHSSNSQLNLSDEVLSNSRHNFRNINPNRLQSLAKRQQNGPAVGLDSVFRVDSNHSRVDSDSSRQAHTPDRPAAIPAAIPAPSAAPSGPGLFTNFIRKLDRDSKSKFD